MPGFTGQDGLNPGVYDLALQPDGTLLAAGYFQYIGRQEVLPLAALQDGAWTQEPSLTELPRPTLSAVAAAPDGRVAVATYSAMPFDLESREGEILMSDGGEMQLVGTFHGAVRTMTWFAGELWVGGVFELDGQEIEGLAVWGEQGWKAPPGGPASGTGVFELTSTEDELLVGGAFWQIGGIEAENVAIWDGTTWTARDLPNATVLALVRDGEDLYAGGLMSVEDAPPPPPAPLLAANSATVPTPPQDEAPAEFRRESSGPFGSRETGGLARWVDGAWQTVGGGLANTTFRGVAADLALHQGQLHVAGCFSRAGDTPAAGIARWTGSVWEALDDGSQPVGTAWFSPLSCGDEGPAAVWNAPFQRLLDGGDRLWVAGFFPGLGGVPSVGLTAWKDGQWLAQGEPARGLSGSARVLAVGPEACDVHALGGFTHAGELFALDRVVRDEGEEWVTASPEIPEGEWCGALAIDDQLHIGCDTGKVYALRDDVWQESAAFAEGGVAALAVGPDGALWAGGGAERGYVAREGERLGETNGRVSALAFDGDRVVAGGMFTEVDGVETRGVALWDGAAWSALGEGLAGTVLAVAATEDGTIYASTADDGTPGRLVLGRWDGASWSEAAEPEPGPTPSEYALSVLLARGDTVVAAGFGWPASDERNVFVLDEQGFRSLAGGLPAIYVESVALAGDGLWFGGTIAEAGGPDERIPSVGVARLR